MHEPILTPSEPILATVKRRLNNSKGEWRKIHEATGVPYGTIVNIAQGKSTNPTLDSVQPLLNYFAAFDAMLERVRDGGAGPKAVAA